MIVAAIAFVAVCIVELFATGTPAAETFSSDISKVEIVQSVSGNYENATNCEIVIVEGDVFSIEYDGANAKETVSWEIANGTLYLDIQTKSDFLGGFLFFSNSSSQIKLTVPTAANIEAFTVEGDILDLQFEDVSLGDLSVDTLVTKLNIYDSVLGDADLDIETGNVTIYDSELGDFDLYSSNSNPLFKSSSFGDLNIWVEIGNIYMDYVSMENSDLYSKLGYIDLTYMEFEDLIVVDDYGSVTLSIVGSAEEYACYARITESGGTAMDEGIFEGTDSTGELKQITITTYYGNIVVTIAE